MSNSDLSPGNSSLAQMAELTINSEEFPDRYVGIWDSLDAGHGLYSLETKRRQSDKRPLMIFRRYLPGTLEIREEKMAWLTRAQQDDYTSEEFQGPAFQYYRSEWLEPKAQDDPYDPKKAQPVGKATVVFIHTVEENERNPGEKREKTLLRWLNLDAAMRLGIPEGNSARQLNLKTRYAFVKSERDGTTPTYHRPPE